MKMYLFFLPFLFLFGCSPHSLEEYQYEGEALCRVIALELQKIHSREDLARELPRLKKHFSRLVDLMIEAKEFQRKHFKEESIDPTCYDHPSADLLKEQLSRVCRLEGGLEMIETAQREALIRLDAFTHALKKKT